MDLSGGARLRMRGGAVGGNVGAVLAWGAAAVTLEVARLQGGVWTTLLADGHATIEAKVLATPFPTSPAPQTSSHVVACFLEVRS